MKSKIELKSISGDKLCLKIDSEKYEVNYNDLLTKERIKLGEKEIKNYETVRYESHIFYIYSQNGKLYITMHLNKILSRKCLMFSLITKKNTYFYGFFSDISKKYKDYDHVFLNETDVCKLKRPIKLGFLKHFAFIKIPNKFILNSGEIHNNVKVGKDYEDSISIRMRRKHSGINYYSRKKIGDNYLIVRTTLETGKTKIVNIKMTPEYERINMMKNSIAHLIYKPIKLFIKPVNLMFEKETNRACESGYYIFEKIMELKNTKSNVYFILNEKSADYEKAHTKYPKNVIKKYSFRHYLYIYLSSYFISSELSNHVINTRIYLENLNRVIQHKPLIFLQHGIMFSKPVDNPAAQGFSKNSKLTNYYKCVISSDLEATQFYKCGFERSDLIKCGLPKFDVSFMKPDADKIMIMLTYRFWEEGLIMNDDTIKDTTYYKTYMKLIEAFEKNNLLDKLIISCHPKFSDCLLKAAPKYKSIIETNVGKGLSESKIFITDYSSASYDAHYRGAYIIYWWAEKDYLIDKYQAIPPIDETNCDGVPVYNYKQLIDEVKKAIKNNYKMDKKYENRYKKINEFHDGKNYKRLIEELQQLNII